MRPHIKETSNCALQVLCEENSPVTGEFPAQRAINAEKASIWWHHHGYPNTTTRESCACILDVLQVTFLLVVNPGVYKRWHFYNKRRFMANLSTSCLRMYHDDVIKWKHFPRYWPFVRGIHRSRWIPRTKVSDAELWCFLWSAPE